VKIVRLSQSKKVPDRWYAELENGDSLRVNLDLIARFSLFSGRQLEDGELAELSALCETGRVRERALRILGARMLSRKELTDRLEEKGESPEEAEKAADWLVKLGFLDDEAYAAGLVRHYAAKGYGPMRIRQELFRRGVPEELRRAAMDEMPDSGETLEQLVAREMGRAGGAPDAARLRKLSAALARRGFPGGEIRRALAKYADRDED
jgi:regulatory protein